MGMWGGIDRATDTIIARKDEKDREERAAERRRKEKAEDRAYAREQVILQMLAQRDATIRYQPKFENEILTLQTLLTNRETGKLAEGGQAIMNGVLNSPSSSTSILENITKRQNKNNVEMSSSEIVDFVNVLFTQEPQLIEDYKTNAEILSGINFTDTASYLEGMTAASITSPTTKGYTAFSFSPSMGQFSEAEQRMNKQFNNAVIQSMISRKEALEQEDSRGNSVKITELKRLINANENEDILPVSVLSEFGPSAFRTFQGTAKVQQEDILTNTYLAPIFTPYQGIEPDAVTDWFSLDPNDTVSKDSFYQRYNTPETHKADIDWYLKYIYGQ